MADGLGNFAPRLQPRLSVSQGIPVVPLGTGQSSQIPVVPLGGGGSQLQNIAPPIQHLNESQIRGLQQGLEQAHLLDQEHPNTGAVDAYRSSAIRQFEKQNIPPEVLAEVRDVVYEKGRFALRKHKSILSTLSTALGAIEAAGAGFEAAYGRTATGAQTSGPHHEGRVTKHGNFMHVLSPWAQYHAIGAGFSEIPRAISQHYTYAQLIQESSDPGSMAYKWAQPIGLGMSILYDPLTYASFGANTAGKEAAYRIIAAADKHAYEAANESIRTGNYGGDFNRIHEAAMDIKVKTGSPMTIGDAMDILHEGGLGIKQQIRQSGSYLDPLTGQTVRASKRQIAGAWGAPTSALGARGVRFAGIQIPGTADAGAQLGKATRRVTGKNEVLRGLGAGLIPDHAARHVSGDGLRASVLVEQANWRAQQQALSVAVGKDVRSLQKVRVHPAASGAVSDEAQAAVNLAGTPDVLKVSPAQRKNLLSLNYNEMPEGPLKNLHHNIRNEAEFFIDQAVDAGANRGDLERTWRFLNSQTGYSDPLAALFDFKLKTGTQIAARNWTDKVLKDRRFSLPMLAGEEAKAAEKAAEEVPVATGHLRPTHISPRSVVTTGDGVEHTMPRIDPSHFVSGVIHDIHGEAISVDTIKQVRDSADQLIWRAHGFVPTGMGLKFLREAPAGYSPYTYAGRRYAVIDPIADALHTIHNPIAVGQEWKRFIGIMQAPQNWWKIYATSPNPSFHVMNFLGAMWNNQLAGVYNPIDYVAAAATLLRGRREEAAQQGERFLFGTPTSTAAGRTAQKTLAEAENRTGLGRTSFLFADVSRGDQSLIHETRQDIAGIGKERGALGRVVAPPEGSSALQTARFYGTKRGRQAAGGALIASTLTGNPAGIMGLFLLAPEAARVGQKLTGTIEDVVRLAPFMKYSKDPTIRQVLHRFGPITVDGMVHPGWTKAEQAAMYDIGAAITQHFQFDYSNLTDTERYVAKSFFPFWSYYKNNFVLQTTELIKHPRSYAASLAMMNYISQKGEDLGPYAAVLPQYFENLQAFQVPVPNFARDKLGLPRDQPLYLNPKMPFLSINLIPPLWQIINDPHETTSQKLLEVIAPVAGNVGPFAPLPIPGAKLVLEAGTGYNLGLNRPIDYQRASSNDYRQSYVDAPSWAKYMPKPLHKFFGITRSKKSGRLIMTATASYVLEQMTTPFINNLGQSIPVGGASDTSRQKARADMVSWGTGVRLIPVDVLRLSRNEGYTMKNILEAKQSELRQQGKELSDKDQEILSNIRDDLEFINQAWDEREGNG